MRYLSSLQNKNLSGKICLLRVDLDIQAKDAENNLRLAGTLPTIKFLIERGTKVVILSHRGRPFKNPKSDIRNQKLLKKFTLKSFAGVLGELLRDKAHFLNFNIGTSDVPTLTANLRTSDVLKLKNYLQNAPPGSIFLLENLRFLAGEEKNDKQLAKKLSLLGDFYVNNAFAVSHRKNASVAAITKFLPSYAGLLLKKEIENLNKIIKSSRRPLVVIIGGAKISDKLGLIKNFLDKADYFLIGGGVANNFFVAKGLPVGDSLYEPEMATETETKRLLKIASKKIILPQDTIIYQKRILDVGPKTIKQYSDILKRAKTIIWNGPMGMFEDKRFAKGTKAIAEAIIKNKKAFSVIGGGETISILSALNAKPYTLNPNLFVSTGGGAMLEYLAGKKLPGIEALK